MKRCASILFPGEELSAVNKPSFIYSPNRKYKFGMAPDGDLSLWHQQDTNGTVVKVWSAGTCCEGTNVHAVLQKSDGNLVVYSTLNETKKALWDSKISTKGTVLEIGNDGKARVFNNDIGSSILRPRHVLWESTNKTISC